MHDLPASYELDLSVRWSETGAGGWMKPATWLDFCMEASDAHARLLKLDMHSVIEMGYYWVMSRYRLAFEATPRARNSVHIHTWPRGFDRLFTLRDFVFSDVTGRDIGRGVTAWLLVKKENFRPVKPADHLPPLPPPPGVAYDADLGALAALADDGARLHRLTVRRDEIDLLGHVSNPHYVRWAIEALEDNLLLTHRMSKLEVDFNGMAFAGDAIEVQTKGEVTAEGSLAFHQSIRKADEVRDLTRLRTEWVTRD